jgi:hypothetical protein
MKKSLSDEINLENPLYPTYLYWELLISAGVGICKAALEQYIVRANFYRQSVGGVTYLWTLLQIKAFGDYVRYLVVGRNYRPSLTHALKLMRSCKAEYVGRVGNFKRSGGWPKFSQ